MSIEPSESPRSVYWWPFWSPVIGGGVSRPTKSFCVSSVRPASTPMYAPDSKVPSPDTPLAPMRGLTTQKRVPLTAKSSASFVSWTSTITCDRFFASVIVFTEPTSTSLYLTLVLPGSRPSALTKLIVIVGPLSATDLMTSATPISAATSGITQTSDGSQLRRGGSMSGSGRSGGRVGPCGLVMFRFLRFFCLAFVHVIPDQAGIELHRSHHREYHHRAKRQRPRSGRDDCER